MACGSCGQRRTSAPMDHDTAQAVARGAPAKYTVSAPNPEDNRTFDRYIDAVTYKRKVNGTLTTST